MDAIMKHLEMIQGIINRMASNSFLLKGWAVTLVAALFALAAKESNSVFFWFAYLPVMAFWGLDGYYLSLERKFRKLYDEVAKKKDSTDFSMDIHHFKSEWIGATFWRVNLVFYGVFIALMCLVGKNLLPTR